MSINYSISIKKLWKYKILFSQKVEILKRKARCHKVRKYGTKMSYLYPNEVCACPYWQKNVHVDTDRDQVFKTTRVRTLLKKDSSWIHGSDHTGKSRERYFETWDFSDKKYLNDDDDSDTASIFPAPDTLSHQRSQLPLSYSKECPVETKPTVTRQSSYVSSTAQKFE